MYGLGRNRTGKDTDGCQGTVKRIDIRDWHRDCMDIQGRQGMNVFNRLAPFIQDFIYENKWEELRGNQVAACEVIFDSDDNLLLSSGTASGKTEAAFLPVLTLYYERPARSVGVMYISPLKALINDQFKRLEQMLLELMKCLLDHLTNQPLGLWKAYVVVVNF